MNEVKADITAEKAEITTANEDKIRFLTELKRIGELKTAAENSLKQLKEEKLTSEEKLTALKEASAKAAKDIAELDGEKPQFSQK